MASRPKSTTALGVVSHPPASAGHALSGGGQPLDSRVRKDMEAHLDSDFSNVRVHTDVAAARSAQELSAEAFTLGDRIAFANDKYSPDSREGRKLLAHELTHVVQQREGGARLQRKLVVNPAASVPMPPGVAGPPTPLTLVVRGLLNSTCPSGGADVNLATGDVTMTGGFCDWAGPPYAANARRADISPTPVGCGCLCDLIASGQTVTIDFMAGGPGTMPVPSNRGTGGKPASALVGVDPRFQGQYLINGKWVDVPFYLLISHELCGHALSITKGTQVPPGPGPAGGTPPHERVSVDVERAIAAEGGQPRRPEDYGNAARKKP